MQLRRRFTLLAATLAATGLVACSDSDSSRSDSEANEQSQVITIGTTDATLREWEVLADLAAAEGIEIEMVNFTEYNTPNQALAEGQTETNKFQHLKFLAEYNVGNGTDLVPVASTQVYPMPLFWKGHDSLDGIEGETVAIPNDATNQGRAINLLASVGLLELKNEGLTTPSPVDIDEANSKVKVVPVDASQTPSAYGEGQPAIVLNSFFERAGINPADAILYDDPESSAANPEILFEPYINVWAVRAGDQDRPEIKRLAELYLSDEVKEAVQQTTGGTTIFVDKPVEELEAILERLENEARNK